MYETLLVAVDHSEASDRAVGVARDLAKLLGANVVVLHLREREVRGRIGPLATEQEDEAEQQVNSAVAVIEAGGVSAHGVILETIYGHAARDIVEQAKERGASLIVMGSRGLTELASLVVGSTAHKVLHLADRPVVVVP
jgi:nucleotide-binding universal stress UspA family protein